MRIVIDTNVYLAAILRPGLSEELVRRGLSGEFTVLSSELILREVRTKLVGKFRYPDDEAEMYVRMIRLGSEIVDPGDILPDGVRDPDDRHVLACAGSGRAGLIMSLDKDLLDLKEWQGVAIVHPKTFRWIVSEDMAITG